MPRKAPTARKPKPRTAPPQYTGPTLHVGETTRIVFAHDSAAAVMVARAVRQSMAFACAFNASACASQRLRLYRKVGARSGKVYPGRQVSRKGLAFLKGHLPGVLPGRKAAEFAEDNENIEEVTEHPFLDLIRQPDPYMTGNNWLTLQFFMLEATGKAFTYTGERSGGVPVSLYALFPQWTRVQPSEAKFIGGYLYGRNTTRQQMYAPEDVIYHRFMVSPTNPLDAMSWTQSLQLEADMESAAAQAEVARWNNGGNPGMILGIDPETYPQTDVGQRQLEASVAARIEGVSKTGKTLVIPGDTSVLLAGHKPAEMAYQAGMEHIRKQILRAAGIPESMMEMSTANLANAQAASPQYSMRTILPRLQRFEDELNHNLLPLFADTGEYFVAFDNPVSEDVAAKVDQAVKLATAGLVKREVLAVELGYLPEDVGSDPNAMPEDTEVDPEANPEEVPENGAGTEAAAAAGTVQQEAMNGTQVTALAALASQVAKGELPEKSARAIARAAYPLITPELLEEIFGGLEAFEPTPETPPELPTPPDNGTSGGQSGEGDVASGPDGSKAVGTELAAGMLGAHGRGDTPPSGSTHGVVGAGGQPDSRWAYPSTKSSRAACQGAGCQRGHPAHRSPHTKAAETEAVDKLKAKLEAWVRKVYPDAVQMDGSVILTPDQQAELESILAPVIQQYMDEGAKATADKLGGEWRGIEANPNAVAWAKQHAAEAVVDIAETTREQLRGIVATGVEKGQSIGEVQAEIREKTPEIATTRAEAIARTETSIAYNRGGVISAKENGYTHKSIDLAGGSCPTCEAVAAAQPSVSIDGFFSVEGELYYSAPLHPKCRCTTLFTNESED